MEKNAHTKFNIHTLLSKRWSPRSFQDKPVEKEKIQKILEAARWSPSAFNEQPWRFIVGIKGEDETYEKIQDSLVQFNQDWSQLAPLLVLTIAKKTFTSNNKPNGTSGYDTGQSVANLTFQATAEGLHLHQMSGFSEDKAIELFNIPVDFEPVSVIAIGYIAEPDKLQEILAKAEKMDRDRKDFNDFVFKNNFGEKTGMFA